MIFRALGDRMVQGILVAEVSMIVIGSVYYYLLEDWSLLGSRFTRRRRLRLHPQSVRLPPR